MGGKWVQTRGITLEKGGETRDKRHPRSHEWHWHVFWTSVIVDFAVDHTYDQVVAFFGHINYLVHQVVNSNVHIKAILH